jgi:hypothetical protein
MFTLCPHCHFLVGLDPRTGAAPARCPKCDRPLGDAREAAAVEVVRTEVPVDVVPVDVVPPARAAAGDASRAQVESPERVASEARPASPATALPSMPSPVPAPEPEPENTSPPRLDADAMIAAMSGRTPRRPGSSRRKAESARPAADAAATAATGSTEPVATAPTRAQRGRRKAEPVAAAAPSEAAPTNAAAEQPQAKRPARHWWTSLLQALRTRAVAKRARKDAKATATTTPAFDPLAASVRNRARTRRAATEAAAAASDVPVADNPGTPAAVLPAVSAEPARSEADASSPASTASTVRTPTASASAANHSTRMAASAPSASVEEPPRNDTATTSSQDQSGTPAVPTSTETPSPALEAQTAPANETPFVERRRNPDLPIPPGTIPTHPLRRRTDAPSFARAQAASAARRSGWRWPAAVAALSLLLVLQLLLAQRDTLAADARWRPAVSALCTLLRCELPPWREPEAFTMLSRDVRAHPSAPGALLINASFRNDARWPQPWPRVLLTLSNADGRIVGARAFAAREYLGADTAATQHELAPGQTAAITLAVIEPAPDIVAFSFDFR